MGLLRWNPRVVVPVLTIATIVLILHQSSSELKQHIDDHAEKAKQYMASSAFKIPSFAPTPADLHKTTPSFVNLEGVAFPESEYVTGVSGFNYFKNLYLVNGAFIFLTSDPSVLPSQGVGYLLSAGFGEDDDGFATFPAGEDRWKVVDVEDVGKLGKVAVRKKGLSVSPSETGDDVAEVYQMFFNDARGPVTSSFLDHYFHCEVFLGAWRIVASTGENNLPARLMYRTSPNDWRDHAGLTSWFQQNVLPETAIEEQTIWEDRAKSRTTYLFDSITIVDRWAAHRFGEDVKFWNKATADLPSIEVEKTWLKPLRDSMKELVQTEGCVVKRLRADVPVVTYINRQLTGRRLNEDDDDMMVKGLLELNKDGIIEFHDAKMETMSRTEQFCLALRTDIMLGVHGNGLSHQLWMKPGSAVVEIMNVGGFARDYAMLAELMSHDYYAIHKNVVFPREKWRRPDGWAVDQGEGFHGSDIRASRRVIAELLSSLTAS
ncbi:hypothetical protein P7C73_g2203, partial [Tremellales sp. Uapishka_1]